MLDPDSDLQEVQLASGMEELRRRLELLLGARPEAAPDVSTGERAEADALSERQERVAEAGGQLLAAAFSFLNEMLPAPGTPAPEVVAAVKAGLGQCVRAGDDGKIRFAVTLPGAQALDGFAETLASLIERSRATSRNAAPVGANASTRGAES